MKLPWMPQPITPKRMKFSRSRFRSVMICGLGCVLVWSGLSAGCVNVSVNRFPPCPTPTEKAIEQTVTLAGTDLEHYLGEIERYCDAVESQR